MAKKTDAKKSGNLGISISLLLLLAGMAVMLPFAILLVVGMLPTVMASIIDSRDEKNITLTVGIMNFCGVIPNLIQLLEYGPTVGVALSMVSNPFTLLMMFAGAAFGWLLIFVMPPIMGYVLTKQADDTIRQLRGRMDQLYGAWGDSIKSSTIEITPGKAEAMLPAGQI
jgi:hypothetical protein